ncbi:hypothetical protein CCACVL1_17400, partial [Corchorus capsularis]
MEQQRLQQIRFLHSKVPRKERLVSHDIPEGKGYDEDQS